MKSTKKENGQVSRRRFLGLTAAAAAFAIVPSKFRSPNDLQQTKTGKPNSKFGGVQIGAITYSWRDMPGSAEDNLKYCLECGISSIELMGDVPEMYAGCPPSPAGISRNATADEKAAFQKASTEAKEAQRKWRISAPMKKFEEFRKMFNDAGVNIHIVKFSPENWSDEEIEYAYNAAKALGTKGVTTEIGAKSAQKLGPIAQKHDLYNILHNHGVAPDFSFEKFLEMSPANMLNFDAGHYFGSTGLNPVAVIEKLHDRIMSVHMKDKTSPKGTPPNTNMPWGKGETPIKEMLLLLKTKKWPIYVDIELEYPVPTGSNSVAEVKKCVEFSKAILV